MLLGEKNADPEVEESLFSGHLKACILPSSCCLARYNPVVGSCSEAALKEMSQAQVNRLPLLFVCQDSHGTETKKAASWGSREQFLKGVHVGQPLHSTLRLS